MNTYEKVSTAGLNAVLDSPPNACPLGRFCGCPTPLFWGWVRSDARHFNEGGRK